MCNLDCFNCSYPDCIRPDDADQNQQATDWRKNNPDGWKKIRRRYYLNHIEQAKSYQKTYYEKIKDDPEYKARKLQRQRERRARKKAEVS